MKAELFRTENASVQTANRRLLFADLNISFPEERVALVGRNGVGKSTLLEMIAGRIDPAQGSVVRHTEPYFVGQVVAERSIRTEAAETIAWFDARLARMRDESDDPENIDREFAAAGLPALATLGRNERPSHGELRKLKLLRAMLTRPRLLLLDEPTNDLDEHGILWLRQRIRDWRGGLLVASHEPRLLQDFRHFFIMSETGCRYISGSFAELTDDLKREATAEQARYVRRLNRLVAHEKKTDHIARRRKRKKQYGRISELGRATPKAVLNQKRDYAQVKHGRLKKIREERLEKLRRETRAARRTLAVNLDFDLPRPRLPATNERVLLQLSDVAMQVGERTLFQNVNLTQRRERLGVTGPNGAGKSTLLDVMRGRRACTRGTVRREEARIGAIAQGGANWTRRESLLSSMSMALPNASPSDLAGLFTASRFPLALAERPLRSLSPGERVRAALLCLFYRSPAVELLILDEPTYSLDLVGRAGLIETLRAWPGGLVVASHDREFLAAIDTERFVELGDS